MTWEQRAEIFAKEILDADDISILFGGISKSLAQEKIRYIRTKSDRIGINGICHIQDYLDCYKLTAERYLMPKKVRAYEEQPQELNAQIVQDMIVQALTALNG